MRNDPLGPAGAEQRVHFPAAQARLLPAVGTPQRAPRRLGAYATGRSRAAELPACRVPRHAKGWCQEPRVGPPFLLQRYWSGSAGRTRSLPLHARGECAPPPPSRPLTLPRSLAAVVRTAPRWRTRASPNTSWTICATSARSCRPLRFFALSACGPAPRRAATCPLLVWARCLFSTSHPCLSRCCCAPHTAAVLARH